METDSLRNDRSETTLNFKPKSKTQPLERGSAWGKTSNRWYQSVLGSPDKVALLMVSGRLQKHWSGRKMHLCQLIYLTRDACIQPWFEPENIWSLVSRTLAAPCYKKGFIEENVRSTKMGYLVRQCWVGKRRVVWCPTKRNRLESLFSRGIVLIHYLIIV